MVQCYLNLFLATCTQESIEFIKMLYILVSKEAYGNEFHAHLFLTHFCCFPLAREEALTTQSKVLINTHERANLAL